MQLLPLNLNGLQLSKLPKSFSEAYNPSFLVVNKDNFRSFWNYNYIKTIKKLSVLNYLNLLMV
jgi:hypothetical protein